MIRQGVGQRSKNSNPLILKQSLKQDIRKTPQRKPQNTNVFFDDGISQIDCFNAKSNQLTSKNPSFSLTSDYSRQYNNQSISEIKAYQKNLFCNSSNSQISYLQNSRAGKKIASDIDDLFVRANNHFKKTTVSANITNQINGYQENQKIQDYKLILKAKDDNIPAHQRNQNHKRYMSITSLKKQVPTQVMEQKVFSDDEGLPFTTVLSYRQELQKQADGLGSFAFSNQSSPSVIESMQKQNKIEEKFRRVSNPFKNQFEVKKLNLVSSTPGTIKNFNLAQDFDASTFNNNAQRYSQGKSFTSQRNTLSGTPDMVCFGHHLSSIDDQTGSNVNPKQMLTQASSATMKTNEIKSFQTQTQIKTSQIFTSQSSNQTLHGIYSTLKTKIVSKSTIEAPNEKENAHKTPIKTKQPFNEISNQVKTQCKPPSKAPKVQEIKLLPQKNLADESEQDDSIDSKELSNKKEICRDSSYKMFKFNSNLDQKKQSHQQEIVSPNFNKPGSNFFQSPQQQQTMSKVFSFNESNKMNAQIRLETIKSQEQPVDTFRGMNCNDDKNRKNQKQLDSLKNVLKQNLLGTNNSAQQRAKWDLSTSKGKQSQTKKNAEINQFDIQETKDDLSRITQKDNKDIQKKREEEEQKYEELQKQYLAIKKQLLELKGNSKKTKGQKSQKAEVREESENQEREIVGVLSSDDSEDDDEYDQEDFDNSSQKHIFKSSKIGQSENKSKIPQNEETLKNHQFRLSKKAEASQFSRQKNNHFKSMDIRNQKSDNRSQKENSPSEKMLYAHQTSNKVKNFERNLKNEEAQLSKISSMKSQIQIGLRKLSYKVKDQSNHEKLVRKPIQDESSQQIYRKSSMKKGKRKSIHSQVSFVGNCCDDGCFSSQSSYRYKDCFSGGSKFKSNAKWYRKNSQNSSSSSKYYLANDGEDLCSCCHEDADLRSSKKLNFQTALPSQRSLKDKEKAYGKLEKMIEQNRKLEKKMQEEARRKSFKNQNTAKKSSRRKVEDNNLTAVKNLRTKSHDKVKNASREERSIDKMNASNRINETLNLWQIPQHFAQQMPFQKMRQSLDQIHHIWPNLNPNFQYQLAQQLQHQPSLFQQGVQQQNFQIYMPQQQMLTPNILNQATLQAHQLGLPNSFESLLAAGAHSQKLIQMGLLTDKKTIQSHKEQIEAIECLINAAKIKLETNLSLNLDDSCKLPKPFNDVRSSNQNSQRTLVSQKEHQIYNTYDNNPSLGRPKFEGLDQSEYQSVDRDHTQRNNQKFQQNYNQLMRLDSRRQSDKNQIAEKDRSKEISCTRNQDQPLQRENSNQRKIALQLEKLSSHFQSQPESQENEINQRGQLQNENQLKKQNHQAYEERINKDAKLKRIKEEDFPADRDWQRPESLRSAKPKPQNNDLQARVITRVNLNDEEIRQKKVSQIDQSLNTTDVQSKNNHIENQEQYFSQKFKEHLRIDLYDNQSADAQTANSISTNQNKRWAMDFSIKDNKEGQQIQGATNLADAFKIKMGGSQALDLKLHQRPLSKERKEFSKQELLERKKELLKQARLNLHQKQQQSPQNQDSPKPSLMTSQKKESFYGTKIVTVDISLASKPLTVESKQDKLSTPSKLFDRLSSGVKNSISKKDMISLSTKNYDQLPEVKKKKYEESKKEDLMKRIATVKELEKKRRQSVVRKRNEAAKNLAHHTQSKENIETLLQD